MTVERKTLGVSQAATPKGDPKSGFAATGARMDKLKDRARAQRRAPTAAQVALWDRIGNAQLGGIKFTRHAVVGSTLVDFACPSKWLAIVLSPDGVTDEVVALQDKKLIEVGVRVMRFAESEVNDDVDGVVRAISAEANKPFTKPGARRAPPRRDGPQSRSGHGAARPAYKGARRD